MSGRVVLVTGASSGIGRAVALHAAGRGDHVWLVARNEQVLDEVADQCLEAGAASACIAAGDVTDDERMADLVRQLREAHERLDAALHCAGVVTYGRAEEVPHADFEQVVSTNLLGAATVARHVVPVLREQQRGALVIVGSLLGHITVPEMTPYVVSKWGLRALAKQLTLENADLRHVHVSHVSPGSVNTPIYDRALDAAGGANRPPPPVVSPERVARLVYRQIDHPRVETQTQLLNRPLILAHDRLPLLWRTLVGPAFQLLSRRRG